MEKNYPTDNQSVILMWQKIGLYDFDKNSNKPLFSIDTPPPTVSGSLHIGHVFSYTQTDIIARFKRLDGFNVFYPFGCDDNGLPTEKFVEKKTGISPFKVGRSAFIKICESEVVTVEENFKSIWQKLGFSINWQMLYTTISPVVRKISQLSFIKLYKQNNIYRKEDPALYCISCHTTVAQAELDDSEKPSVFYTINFKDHNNADLPIATTRPELLPSCVAVFCHPEDIRFKHLISTKIKTAYYNREVIVIADKKVIPEKGTGLVMCCTFGDKTDIEWFREYKLDYKPAFDNNGKWLEDTGILAGLKTKAAREKIVEVLKESGLLIAEKQISHNVNVHERCKNEIEYLIIAQWFLEIIKHKSDLLKIADDIEWQPAFMKSRYLNWVENLSWDWCLSRQRFFGIPFPVWHCECQEIILASEQELPIDPQEIGPRVCPKCAKLALPDTDVMDTWNTSSLTPQICNQLFNNQADIFDYNQVANFIPMSMRPQAHDIIRTWAFYTIIKSWLHFKKAPWKTITISGHVLSAQNDKISKSQGNTPTDPEKLLANYPADVIRYWTACGTLGQDMAFSETQFKIGQKLLTKIWNAFKFIKENQKSEEKIDLTINNIKNNIKNLDTINSYILHKVSETFIEYKKYFEKGEFGLALEKIENCFWKDFCDNHLELVKDQFFHPENYSSENLLNTNKVLLISGLQILQMYAPYIPFITEAIFTDVYKDKILEESIFNTNFATIQNDYKDFLALPKMIILQSIIDSVRKLKSNSQLSLKTELETLTLVGVTEDFIKEHEQIIKGITKSKKIVFALTGTESLIKLDDSFQVIVKL